VETLGWKVGCARFVSVITKDMNLPGMGAIDARQKVKLSRIPAFLLFFFSHCLHD
jgi:hypothetical protein